MKSKAEQQQEFQHKTFVLMFRILVIFGLPAALAYFVGRYIDTIFDIRPTGSILALVVAFIISWVLIFRMYFALERERKAIDALEDDKPTEPEHIDQALRNKADKNDK